MDVSGRRLWVRAMILVAVSYVVIGIGFAALAKSDHMRLWRLAAWVASALVAAAHIGYEHYRLGSSPRPTALHAAGAVALGPSASRSQQTFIGSLLEHTANARRFSRSPSGQSSRLFRRFLPHLP